MSRIVTALCLAAAAACGAATPAAAPPDPTQTDGDKYHVVLENQRVRVLRYSDRPGDVTHLHHHPDFVLYALSPFRRKLRFPDGSEKVLDFEPGDVRWVPAQSHVGENVGTTPSEALLIEPKR